MRTLARCHEASRKAVAATAIVASASAALGIILLEIAAALVILLVIGGVIAGRTSACFSSDWQPQPRRVERARGEQG